MTQLLMRLWPSHGLLCLILTSFAYAQSPTTSAVQPAPPLLNLVDVTGRSHIDFVHATGASGQRYIVETVVAGLALFDYDQDGYLDIYFLNGRPLPGSPANPQEQALPNNKQFRNALYRNNGDWTFTDVTLAAGVPGTGYGMGVAVSDFDEDGDDDLYLANFGRNNFYVNNGDGTFSEGTEAAGLQRADAFGTGVVWFDIDNDGDLDLYAGNYVNFSFDQHKTRLIAGHQFHPGPAAYPPALHDLFRNEGDGTFTNISQASGIAATPGPGMGAIALDVDDDGDSDLFVCNDGKANFLFINDGRGNFVDQAFVAGVAVDRAGTPNGNMGVDAADIDGDGLLDLLTTDYQDELPVLYRNQGGGLFEDMTTRAKIDVGLVPHVKWGIGLIDIDNDADRDAYIACGHFLDNIRFVDDRTDQKVVSFLLLNDGRGRFSNVSKKAGSGLQVVASSRGAAFDDLDNDGDTDIVVLNSDGPPTLIRNDSRLDKHWLDVKLLGRESNRSAAGASVLLTSSGKTQVLAVHLGRGYQSHYGTRLHFGLNDAQRIERLEVRWPSGHVQTIEPSKLSIDTTIEVLETSPPPRTQP